MKTLTPYGAAGTVTGSNHLLVSNDGKKILVDMGMFQGNEDIQKLNYEPLGFNPAEIDAVILTHAHLDHCGRLPMLSAHGFKGIVYATQATYDLASVVMYDSAKIAQYDDDLPIIYNYDDVAKILNNFKVVSYNAPFDLFGYSVEYKDAGHLLGSALVRLTEKETGKKIIFSGDLGNMPAPLLKSTETFDEADVVVMESTYGARNHPDENPLNVLESEIHAVERNNSVLMIPAFSLERTQVILHMIKHLKKEGKIERNTPIYLDSPMGITATEIYKDHTELFNDHVRGEFKADDAFDMPALHVMRKTNKRIFRRKGTKVIIAGSGMMTGGRILGHAKKYLDDPKNRLLIVGYQGEDTLGREIVEGAKVVKIDDEVVDVNANLTVLRSMSAHADQKQLLTWLESIKGVQKVILIHGEDDARKAITPLIQKLGINDIESPKMAEPIKL